MTAIQGIVSPIADPNTGVYVGPEWIAALDSLRPGQPLAIKGSISAGADNTVHIEGYKAGLHALQNAGHHVTLLLEENLWFQNGVNPNDVLYTLDGTVAQANKWIDNYSLTACQTLNALGEDCPSVVIISNEYNVQNPHLLPGDVVPSNKPEALSPQVAAAATWLTATRIKSLCPQIKTVYPAAMSDLVKFNTSLVDGWIGGFLTEEIQYLQSLGLSSPWPWEGILLNCEGAMTQEYTQYVMYGSSHLKSSLGISGPTIFSEWGTPAQGLDEAVMTAAFEAMNAAAYSMYFFSSGVYQGYGVFEVQVVGNRFVPEKATAWLLLLQKLYQGTI